MSLRPDTWMPLYWADFIADTLHLNRSEIGSYTLMIGAYWRKGGPLPDNDDELRQICRCDLGDWMKCRGAMEKLFTVSDGLWRHKRIDKELVKARQLYQSRNERTKAATEARQRNVQRDVNRNDERNVDTTTTTTTTTLIATPTIVRESTAKDCEESPECPEYPSWELVSFQADKIGLPEWKARDWFDEMEGCGWLDHKSRPVMKWRSVLLRVKSHWDSIGRPAQAKPVNGTKPVNLMIHNDELKRVEVRLKTLRERYDSNAGYSKSDADEIKRLNTRKKELRELLGVKV